MAPVPVEASTLSMPQSTEPMQIGYTRVSPEERRRRLQEHLCFYCGQPNHQCKTFPNRANNTSRKTVSIEHVLTVYRQNFTLCVSIEVSNKEHYVSALVDSGAAVNLIHEDLVQELKIPTLPCIPSINITAVDNKPIGQGISQQTFPITLKVGLFHTEKISFYVISSPKNQIILGHPWLAIHDPSISWNQGEITKWSLHCQEHFFNSKITFPCLTTSVESPDTSTKTVIPSEYSEFSDVFNKANATQLPPHRPWDCAIELLPNITPPKSKVYPLSRPETQAMEN